LCAATPQPYSGPMITHIKFVSIPTRDQDRALAFWTEKIGFRVLTDQPFDEKQRWIELRVGTSDTRFVLFTFDASAALQPGSPFNGALACDDVEGTHRELSKRGVEFTSPPQKQPWGTFATFKDPDGNEFVLSSK
jgi:catechol 2,3-dioxygenase-like lactoylglutathione lyase family enzyme